MSLKADILDTGWEPEPGRRYTDAELRFCPLYRAFRAKPWYTGVSDAEVLSDCREVLAALQAQQTDDAADDGMELRLPKLRLI